MNRLGGGFTLNGKKEEKKEKRKGDRLGNGRNIDRKVKKHIVDNNWTIRWTPWKHKSNVEKMNSLWFWFRILIFFSIITTAFELYRNWVTYQALSGLL